MFGFSKMQKRWVASWLQELRFSVFCDRFPMHRCSCNYRRCLFLLRTPRSCLCGTAARMPCSGDFFCFQACSVVVLDTCMIREVHLYNLMSPAHICVQALNRDVWS